MVGGLLMAEELVLLLLDDRSGRWLLATPGVRRAVRVAMLAELLARGALTLDHPPAGALPTLRPGAAAVTADDPLLDRALRRASGRSVQRALAPDPRELGLVLARLRRRGVLRRASVRRRRHLARDAHLSEAGVRDRVLAALAPGARPDRHTSLLVVLVDALGLLPALFPGPGLPQLVVAAARLRARLAEDPAASPIASGTPVPQGEWVNTGDVLDLLFHPQLGDGLRVITFPLRAVARALDGMP